VSDEQHNMKSDTVVYDEQPEKPNSDEALYNKYKVHRTITVETIVHYAKELTFEEVRADEEELDDVMVSIDGDDDNEVKVTDLRLEHA
jgi:hypothetical protein